MNSSRIIIFLKMRKPKIKLLVRLVLIVVFIVSPLLAFLWVFNNATLFFSRLAPDGSWGFYATRAEMMEKKYDGPVHWFRGWRAVPKDAVDIAYVGVTTYEGCGPWETRLTCRTTRKAFLDMAREYGYTIATNCFENVLREEDGGFPNDSPAYVEVLPELWPLTMPREYLTFTCLTTNYTGMVILLNCRNGKLYARLINSWRFGDPKDWSWLKALPTIDRLMLNEHDAN